GLARGYLNKEELTAEKFIENPFSKGTLMYDTGDLARWQSDGNIEYIGRSDHQVKIRGFRIELGEIEHAIQGFSDSFQGVVVEAREVNQEKVLLAYVSSSTDTYKEALRAYLQEQLPDYMVPSFYITLEKLPLSPNGKIDRKQLPGITSEDLVRKAYVAPKNILEQTLLEIWQEVLGVEGIGTTDNFFELGGHSLIVSQVINRMYRQTGKTVSFKTFFTHPTIAGVSEVLEEDQ
ncbi:phosphopantetheine-binding protein, partial [Flavobacterium psychroterrae]